MFEAMKLALYLASVLSILGLAAWGGYTVRDGDARAEVAKLQAEWDAESLRPHYAKTLWHWVDRLQARREEAVRLVGEKRLRVWLIYMAGSAHAFSRGWISIFQVLGVRATDNGTVLCPLTRSHLYK